MKNVISALALSLLQVTASNAAPAFYKDSLLQIKEGIVVLGEEIRYYKNLQLEMKSDGDFRVVEGESLSLAQIDELTVAVLFTEPVQVELLVQGNKSIPCVELESAVTREGDTFYVAVAERQLQTFDVCIQVLEPYELLLELDVADLPPGDYLVKVNRDVTEFTLEGAQ